MSRSGILQNYDERITALMQEWHVPGCAVAIIQQGEVIHSSGYGFRNVEHKSVVDADTIFAIGSTSKAFTAVSAAILVDRGLLQWDAPVRRYLPDFELDDAFARQRMTVRDLLSHRSGLPRHDAMWFGSPFCRQELMSRLKYLKPSADFRTTFQYQNLMFMAAGALVGEISGQTWEQFTRDQILDPLGMTRTTLAVAGLKADQNAAKPYAIKENGHRLLDYRNLDAISPAGGVNSCLIDLVKWLSLHLEDGRYQGKQIVSAKNLRLTHQPHTFIENSPGRLLQNFSEIGPESYALGWFGHNYRGQHLLRHGGHIDGFSTQISFMPEIDAGVIVLSNLGGSSFMFMPTFLAYDLLLGFEPLDWSERIRQEEEKTRLAGKQATGWYAGKRKKKTQPSHDLRDYKGIYRQPAYGDIEIGVVKEKLIAEFNGRQVELSHYHYDVFDWASGRSDTAPLKVHFSSDALGHINSLAVPLEPNVEPALFVRLPKKSFLADPYLSSFTGVYIWEGKQAQVLLNAGKGLTIQMPGFPQLNLIPYQQGVFKVSNQANWLVEFIGKPVMKFHLVQPSSLFTAEKMDRGNQ